MKNETGKGLSILISCDYIFYHNWMAFLCWYSISKNLPDAKVVIGCNRQLMTNQLFNWTKKVGIPFKLHKEMSKEDEVDLLLQEGLISLPVLVLDPCTLAIRDFEESGFDIDKIKGKIFASEMPDLCCDAKEDRFCVFVTYFNGWGKFITSNWINNLNIPNISNKKYKENLTTANEVRIVKIWENAGMLLQTLLRC
jgi:hypothetical protein